MLLSVNAGGVSTIVIVKVAEPMLPALSFAVHVTVVVPIGNVAPEAIGPLGVEQLAGRLPSTLSTAAARNDAGAPAGPRAGSVWLGPAVITGGVRSTSRTVIVKLDDPVLPAASVAEQVTIVAPIGNVWPD